jgi:hypothetical protein
METWMAIDDMSLSELDFIAAKLFITYLDDLFIIIIIIVHRASTTTITKQISGKAVRTVVAVEV